MLKCKSAKRMPDLTSLRVQFFGTPVMAYDLWGSSPLYENENLKEGSVPIVTLIVKLLDEGCCGEVTNRGEEACELVGQLTKNCRDSSQKSYSVVQDLVQKFN